MHPRVGNTARPVGSVTASSTSSAASPPFRGATRVRPPDRAARVRPRPRSRSYSPAMSGNVPASPNGFWVASTRKGSGRSCCDPSTVRGPRPSLRATRTARSASPVDLVDEQHVVEERTRAKVPVAPLLIEDRDPGDVGRRRSAVPCTRPTVPPIDRATALASRVLPTPGASSINTWPLASSAATTIAPAHPCRAARVRRSRRSRRPPRQQSLENDCARYQPSIGSRSGRLPSSPIGMGKSPVSTSMSSRSFASSSSASEQATTSRWRVLRIQRTRA